MALEYINERNGELNECMENQHQDLSLHNVSELPNMRFFFENRDHGVRVSSLGILYSYLSNKEFNQQVNRKVHKLKPKMFRKNLTLKKKMQPFINLLNGAEESLLTRKLLVNNRVVDVRVECKLLFRFICILQAYGALNVNLKKVDKNLMVDVVVHFRLLFKYFVKK
jgi:hypothetical protein